MQKKIERNGYLAEKIVIVDGLPGCGKTMLSSIIASLERVEKLSYAYDIEHVCQLHYLDKIDCDATAGLIQLWTDLLLYNLMMSREINFRFTDLSSVFRDARPLRYIKRLFLNGDEKVPARIKEERPILHLTTHRLLGISEPVFAALGKRAVIIEIVRHPLYMLKQEALNMERLLANTRHFTVYFSHNDKSLPYFALGWEELFLKANPVEKAIFEIERLIAMTDVIKNELQTKYKADILTIPFEIFVTNPSVYIGKIGYALGTRDTPLTRKIMKRQGVPRKMYSQGVGLASYRRCGWQPPCRISDEKKEFEIRRRFASERASIQAMEVLDKLCSDYEEKYLGGIKKTGEHYA